MKTNQRAGVKAKRAAKKTSAVKIAQRYLEVQRLRQQLLRAQFGGNPG